MIYFTGDINFSDGFFDTGFGIGSNVCKGNDPFKYINHQLKDIWFGNLECVVSNTSNKTGIYRKQFRVSPGSLSHIQHFDIYNVANNHVMQHGKAAYKEMINFLDASGILYIGANDKRTIEFSHQGKQIGILSFSQREEKYCKIPLYWYNPEYSSIELEFNKIKHLDCKIAYIHWGNEFIDRPYVDQKKFAHWLIDIGFDLIVGVHPHVLQGYEIYNGKYIFYSLGNFLFNMPLESTRYSIILKLDFLSSTLKVGYDYIKINYENFPEPIEADKVSDKYKFEYLNEKLKIENENEMYYESTFIFRKKYRITNIKSIIKSLYKYKFLDLLSILSDFIKRRLIK